MKKILILPRLKIHNANALSSPYTIGFPAMTAWLGFTHALQLRINKADEDFEDLKFNSMAVVCHEFNLQTYKGESDFNHSIISTSNPLKKDGKRPSTIEEARCHLIVSLLIEYSGIDQDEALDMKEAIPDLLQCMKIASGDLMNGNLSPELIKISNQQETRKLMSKVMPGFTLVERRDLMIEAMQNENLDGMDALLAYLSINSMCHEPENNENKQPKAQWIQSRKHPGWLVPIATGFQGISVPAIVENQRHTEYQHRFAETVVTLGEFIMPTRIEQLDHMLWHYADVNNNLYLCQQNQPYQNEQE
jgi:CRISPR-associated protein Csy2